MRGPSATRTASPTPLTRISRNKAFIFKAPPGLGNLKLTHKGASKAIDILNGYCLVYGTHRTGVRIFLENPTVHPAPAPAWVIEWIHKYRSETGGTPKIDPHTPPVRLGLESVKWWTGEKAVTGPDGDVDRSTTLFNIGMVLARANASVEAIATALEERDQSLGYAKYSERRDGPVRYAEIAARAVSHVATMPFRRVANGHSPRHLTGWEVRG